jgi:hypothetical protein
MVVHKVVRRPDSHMLYKIGYGLWLGCQCYSAAALYPSKFSLFISVTGGVDRTANSASDTTLKYV